MDTGSAEEAIVVMSNGGTWFRFQNPFTITEDDISNNETFKMKLVFNPRNIIKGYESSTRTGGVIKDTGSGYVINVPMLDLSPIAHKSSDSVIRETYELHYPNASSPVFDVRLELYYLNSDSSKTIYGVDVKYIYTSSSSEDLGDYQKIAYVVESGGVLTFQDYLENTAIGSFTRGSSVGDTGTAVLGCDTTDIGSYCTSGTISVETELVAIETVE